MAAFGFLSLFHRQSFGAGVLTAVFTLTLGYSRKATNLLTFQSSSRVCAELHEQAFQRLGGSTRTVVLDNLGETQTDALSAIGRERGSRSSTRP